MLKTKLTFLTNLFEKQLKIELSTASLDTVKNNDNRGQKIDKKSQQL
jgi:hypothetical protein